jgi:16S rRNA G966 N2-methylase RsmD
LITIQLLHGTLLARWFWIASAARGAEIVHFVDSDEVNIAQIHKNAQELSITYNARIGFFPKCKIKEQFDIIFVDPPYIAAQSQILKTISGLLEFSLLPSGLLILEIEKTNTNLASRIGEVANIVLDYEVSDKTRLLFLKKG